jgi:hypothetical protein
MPVVAQASGTIPAIALGKGAHPVGRVAGDCRHLRCRLALGQPPEDLPVAAGDRILSGAITALQHVKREMGLD